MHREKVTRDRLCAPLLADIIEIKTKSVSSYENLYRKIVSYLLLKIHSGNPTDLRVVRETTGNYQQYHYIAALESVFPQSELSTFISLSRSDKEAQLYGSSQLVTGIRLFNKQIGKGGESIESSKQIFH